MCAFSKQTVSGIKYIQKFILPTVQTTKAKDAAVILLGAVVVLKKKEN